MDYFTSKCLTRLMSEATQAAYCISKTAYLKQHMYTKKYVHENFLMWRTQIYSRISTRVLHSTQIYLQWNILVFIIDISVSTLHSGMFWHSYPWQIYKIINCLVWNSYNTKWCCLDRQVLWQVTKIWAFILCVCA